MGEAQKEDMESICLPCIGPRAVIRQKVPCIKESPDDNQGNNRCEES